MSVSYSISYITVALNEILSCFKEIPLLILEDNNVRKAFFTDWVLFCRTDDLILETRVFCELGLLISDHSKLPLLSFQISHAFSGNTSSTTCHPSIHPPLILRCLLKMRITKLQNTIDHPFPTSISTFGLFVSASTAPAPSPSPSSSPPPLGRSSTSTKGEFGSPRSLVADHSDNAFWSVFPGSLPPSPELLSFSPFGLGTFSFVIPSRAISSALKPRSRNSEM